VVADQVLGSTWLTNHHRYFLREARVTAYGQFLQSYKARGSFRANTRPMLIILLLLLLPLLLRLLPLLLFLLPLLPLLLLPLLLLFLLLPLLLLLLLPPLLLRLLLLRASVRAFTLLSHALISVECLF